MRTLLLLVLLLWSGTSLVAQTAGDRYFQQAKEQIEAGDIKKASKLLTSARNEYLKEKNYYRYFVASQSLYMAAQDEGRGEDAEKLIRETMTTVPLTNEEQADIHAKLHDNLAYTYLYSLDKPEAALEEYNQCVRLYTRARKESTSDMAMTLINRGTTQYSLMHFDDAVADIAKGISIYEQDPETEKSLLAGNYRTLGLCQSERYAFQEALTAYQKAFQLATPDDGELKATVLNDIGNIYQQQRRYVEARKQFTDALAINESQFGKDADHYCLNLINLANVQKDMGDLEGALRNFQDVLAIYQKTPPTDDTNLTDLLLNVSRVCDEMGLVDESRKMLDGASAYVKEKYGEGSLTQADIYLSMAVTAFGHGEWDESLDYNFKALSIMEANKLPMSSPYATIYHNIGQAYDEQNDFALALQYKNKAVDLYRKLYGARHPSVAMALAAVGLSYEKGNQYDKALEYLKQALEIQQSALGERNEEVGLTCLNIGLVYIKKMDGTHGIEYLERARKIYDGYSRNVRKAMIYNRLAFGYELTGNRQAQATALQKAIIANVNGFDDNNFANTPVKPDFLDYYELIISYTVKADYFSVSNDKPSLLKAAGLLDEVDRILNEKAMGLRSSADRLELAQVNSFFSEAGFPLMEKLYQQTRDPQYLHKAFYFSERSKANELFADLQRTKASAIAGIPNKLLQRRQELMRQSTTLRQQITSAYDAGDQALITRLKAQNFDLTKQMAALEKEMATASPQQKWMTRGSLPSWNEVASTLEDGTALVAYTITDSAKYVLVGNRGKLTMRALPKKADLDKLVRGFTNQVKFQSPGLKTVTDQLTELLWAPIESALTEIGPATKVIIIPDGPLSYLPFEALGKDRYLLEQYSIYYQLSAALVLNRAAQTNRNKPSFVALAPVFADKETNYINKSCQRFVQQAQKTDSTTRAFSLNGEYITPLPATEDEVTKINQIHADKGIFSKYFTHEEAREELIKKGDLAGFDYIHFATHGFVNSQYPELSGLLLTQDKNSQEDGILYSGEIAGLTLKADLVTLSACETALGKKIEGEGVRGLTTAFITAGARSVIASLWKVADESTAELMVAFYTELLSGKDKATALQLAKKSLLAKPNYKHPYYWAPFVQIGSNAVR